MPYIGNEIEAFVILQRALELEDKLPMANIGGSARLLLDQRKSDRAFAVVRPILNEWSNMSTLGYVLFDGPIIIPVLRLVVEHNVVGATRMLDLFSVPVENKATKEQLPSPLTPRECDVLKLLAAGLTNIQISDEFYVSSETVKSHVEHIFNKLDVHSRTQAVIRVRELGL